eukprot:scaffold913_cov137-Skeletonema_dohrnii-CCMP3373.AAC.11
MMKRAIIVSCVVLAGCPVSLYLPRSVTMPLARYHTCAAEVASVLHGMGWDTAVTHKLDGQRWDCKRCYRQLLEHISL